MTIVEGKRYDLGRLYEVPCATTREIHGIRRVGVWITKSGRVIVETDSIWGSHRNDGTTVGTQYHFASAHQIASLAEELGDERLLALVPVADDA